MKKNGFYLLVGCIALALLGILWYSVENHLPPIAAMISFIAAIVIIYLVRQRVEDLIDDERSIKITEKAMVRTFQVFWVVFAAFSIGAIMELLHVPAFPRPSPPPQRPPEILPLKSLGYIQLGLLCLMIFLYVGFRIYYARQYGEWETDEE